MEKQFPRTTVGGMSLSRMIIGTNWVAGWSHTSPAADQLITDRHGSGKAFEPMLEAFQKYGVDTVMGPFTQLPHIVRAIRAVEQKVGKPFILVDTPIINVDDNENARREAAEVIHRSRELGASFCLLHHTSAEQLVDKNKGVIRRLDDYTRMIRDEGMLPGLSAHMPELVVYSDANGYDVETYIQLYNCMGFLMQVEVEAVHGIIQRAKKPVMTIKSMAAGRCSPFVGLNFSWATLRDCDMVTVGCFTEREALEDIEISLAALERRVPVLSARSSPNQAQAALRGQGE
ncbi:MAG: hypothetical protein HFE43_08835 [Oscillospiraceae bacterium]|jgi:hypothetical protein|nr:hypothetical protein [Oscillospiraceae bacterium]